MKVEREKALEHKKRMSRMMEDKESFVSKITVARSFIYEVRKEMMVRFLKRFRSCEHNTAGTYIL